PRSPRRSPLRRREHGSQPRNLPISPMQKGLPKRKRRVMTETAPSASIELTYREAVREAIREALHRDERAFLMGEDVGRYGGCYAVSKGLLAEFGPDRIRDTPLSESGFTGAGIGAAMAGMRPIVEVMTVNFSLLALDQILNNAATIRHMSAISSAVRWSSAWPPA